ncbi:MAG: tRNA (guanosine(46)-N7)-methyltransferase TrmB [Deltaproteobacteria bacterium]|nr:tRNA (guanosine(46)-N7)-methyltransferase TrmB [Deltaproteobacteria bacterium]
MKRLRRHVNPLSSIYRAPVTLPQWAEVFENVSLPLHMDIGTGRGHFLLNMARRYPDWNFLGVEIRKDLVERANLWVQEKKINNLHYLFCNINVNLEMILKSFRELELQRISVQFPDPWVKKRHYKRRTITQEFVDILSSAGSYPCIYLSSDVESIAEDMKNLFLHSEHFQLAASEVFPWDIRSEWEEECVSKNRQVWKSVFNFRF